MITIKQGSVVDTKGVWEKQTLPDGRKTALMSCPLCGMIFSLGGDEILEHGMVFPEVTCHNYSLSPGTYPCSFHGLLKLEGWEGS